MWLCIAVVGDTQRRTGGVLEVPPVFSPPRRCKDGVNRSCQLGRGGGTQLISQEEHLGSRHVSTRVVSMHNSHLSVCACGVCLCGTVVLHSVGQLQRRCAKLDRKYAREDQKLREMEFWRAVCDHRWRSGTLAYDKPHLCPCSACEVLQLCRIYLCF
jgi:hypothetical protein